MANKAPVSVYDTDWAKIKSWATAQKIPTAAVNNVLALDNSRLQNGYQIMSNPERTRAILAASGMNYNTALPTDNPSASDVVGNTIRNAQGIFTGLMPTRLFSNIWGTLKNTVQDIENPQKAGGLGKMLENTALSWLPGAYDLGQVIQAHGLEKGLEDLAQQPITSILDVMPFLSGGSGAISALAATGRLDDAAAVAATRMAPRLAKKLNVPEVSQESTVVGEALAKRLGVTPKAIAQMGAVRMAGKAVGSIKIGKEEHLYPGMKAPAVPTIGERLGNIATKTGVGKHLATAAHTLSTLRAKYSADYREKRKVLKQKVADLSPDEVDKATNMVTKEGEYSEFNRVMHSGRGPNEIIDDKNVPVKVREAVKAYRDWLDWHQDLMLKTGRILPFPILEQDGSITTAFYRPEDIAALTPLREDYEAKLTKADEASQKGDTATANGATLDAAFVPIQQDMATIRDQITNVITQAGGKIPTELGKVIGKGGYFDNMVAAARANDWARFNDEVKKAQTALDRLDKAIPRNAIPDAPLYHGTSRAFAEGRPVQYGPGLSSRNLFGPGLYTTDSKDIGLSYTKKGATRTGEQQSRTVYGLDWKGPNPPRMLDLETTLPPEAATVVRTQLQALEEGPYSEFTFPHTKQLLDNGAKGAEVLLSFRKELGETPELLSSEADDIFDSVAHGMESAGFDGYQHTGGLIAGKGKGIQHTARVFFNPDKLQVLHTTDAGTVLRPEAEALVRHLQGSLKTSFEHGERRAKLETAAKKAYTAKVTKLNKDAEEAQYRFLREATKRAPEYRDAIAEMYFKNLENSDKGQAVLDASAAKAKEAGYDQRAIDQLRRSDPQRLYEIAAIGGDAMFHDPFLPNMTPGDHAHFLNDAIKNVTLLRSMGERPMWVPTTSGPEATSLAREEQVFVNPTKAPKVGSTMAKAMDASRTVNDVMLGVNRATQEIMSRHASIDFVAQIVVPMLVERNELENGVNREEKARAQIIGQTAWRPAAITEAMIDDQFGMSRFNINQVHDEYGNVVAESDLERETGLKAADLGDLGLDPTKQYYIPSSFKKQLPKLIGDQFPLHGGWDKTTGVFKWSILALSPRYTAHVLFGGGMLLALAIDPQSWGYIAQAAKMVNAYHHENLDDTKKAAIFQGASPRGSPDQDYHFAGGDKGLKLAVQGWLHNHGIDPRYAKGIDIVKAAGDLNFRFTNYISDMQRAVAYLDGMRKAEQLGYVTDPITGDRIEMTPDKAHFMGLQAAERVMGNLTAMTPFERSLARKIMPFYGWTKHILQYVMRFPMDHPWRTMYLSTLATQNSDSFASGLDTRLQLLLFLGHPDVNGNVTGLDVRQINPFRDVANYATLQGWLSALNPILTAPIAAVDPSIIYGGNQLYPSVTYNSLYGTNVAGPAGSPITMAEQFIPEFGALDDALGISAQARAVKSQGGSAQLKDMLSSLGIPWTPQALNLQQISAKHEVDRYNQARTDALNAWQSGDFSTIDKYPANAQLPDPLGTSYNITPAELKAQYAAAKKRYPGLPPSETVPNLPTGPL